MLKDLHQDHLKIVKLLTNLLETAKKAEDEVTIDIAIERLRIHQKNIWMIEATLEK